MSKHYIYAYIFKAYLDDILELKMSKCIQKKANIHAYTWNDWKEAKMHEQQQQIVYVLVRLNYYTSGNINVFPTK